VPKTRGTSRPRGPPKKKAKVHPDAAALRAGLEAEVESQPDAAPGPSTIPMAAAGATSSAMSALAVPAAGTASLQALIQNTACLAVPGNNMMYPPTLIVLHPANPLDSPYLQGYRALVKGLGLQDMGSVLKQV